MAVIGLSILYCLTLTLPDSGIKPFVLEPPSISHDTGYYLTPASCTSENCFFLRQFNDASTNERWESRVDFLHREYLAKKTVPIIQTNEWSVKYYSRGSGVSVTVNGNRVWSYQIVALSEGDQIQMKYQDMLEPLNFVYGKCSQINDTVTTEEPMPIQKHDQMETEELDKIVNDLNKEMIKLNGIVRALNSFKIKIMNKQTERQHGYSQY